MKALKILGVVLIAYVGLVVVFESLLGYFQPEAGTTLVLTTFEEDGTPHERVVSRLESDDQLYVAANHWPRAWYRRALDNPRVEVRDDGEERTYRAVPATGDEHDRVQADNPLGIGFRILTGFPPRYFVRLDPVVPDGAGSSGSPGFREG